MSSIHVLPLTARETEILELLEQEADGKYPFQFSLEWLTKAFYQKNADLIAPSNALTSIRSTMASLGLKLMGVGAGHIRRLTRRGAGQKGVYELQRNMAGRVVLLRGRPVITMEREVIDAI